MKIIASNIDWDTESNNTLPTELTIEVPDFSDTDDIMGCIEDYCASEFGYCVNGYTFDFVKDEM